MQISLKIQEKPETPTGSEMEIELIFGYLMINFHPPTINRLLK